jgi:hypothetical protein
MIAFSGSTTRKKTTALTLTETLSREITSCDGTSITTRRSTRTICCRSRDDDHQARALDLPEAAELEHHAALVLAQDRRSRAMSRSNSSSPPAMKATTPPTPSTPKVGREQFGGQQRKTQQDQRQPRVVDRQHLQREQASSRQIAPTVPGTPKPGEENSKIRP